MLSRRALLAALPWLACDRRGAPSQSESASPRVDTDARVTSPAAPRGAIELVEWTTEGVCTRAAVIVPRWRASERLPVLVALHGRGEAVKAPAVGALGWPRDYALTRAIDRVCHPPLADVDYEGFSEPSQLAAANAQLASRPFAGLVVVCPHVPDIDLSSEKAVAEVGRFIVEVLLSRTSRELPALDRVESTGIDGVSMGGHLALRIGFAHADRFGAVGALQAALAESAIARFVDAARAARSLRPNLAVRLTTSHDDGYASVNRSLSKALRSAGVVHEFAEVAGPHDYAFNRGPGAYEMLLWHERTLRRG